MFKESILKLNRRTKKLIIIFVDYCSIISSFYIASYLLFQNIRIVNIGYLIVIFLPPFIAILFYYYSNLYQNILRFMQTGTFFTLFKGAFFYSIVLMTAPLLLMDDGAFAFSLIMVNFFTLMFLSEGRVNLGKKRRNQITIDFLEADFSPKGIFSITMFD